MDIEEVAHPRREDRQGVHRPAHRAGDAQALQDRARHRVPGQPTEQAVDLFKNSTACYMDTDASLVEINPLNRDSTAT